MKRIVLLLALAMVMSCKAPSPQGGEENFIPDTPVLTSRIMTPEVLWSFGRLGDQVVSPDGRQAAYTVTWYDVAADKSFRDVYVVSLEERQPVRITDTGVRESALQWRPDGKKIGYLSAVSGSSQIWEMNPDGSDQKQVSFTEGDIQGFLYSPASDKVCFIKSVKLDQDIHDLFPDLPKANARLEHDLMYRHWDSWHDYTYNHLFIAGYHDGRISDETDINSGERFDTPMKPFGGTESLAWDPSGERLVYTSKKLSGKAYSLSTNSDLFLYDVASGTTTNLSEGMPGYDRNPRFSPDGTMIAWESMARDGYEADKVRLFVADLRTGEKSDRTADFDQNAESLCWGRDGKSILFLSSTEGTEQICQLDLITGAVSYLTRGIHNYTSLAVAGDRLVAARNSMSQPAELYLVDPATGLDEPLTSINREILDQLTMGKVENRWIKTTDGKDMLTWVIFPPDFDPAKKYPAILYCQGGPQNTVSQYWSYRWNFQMMAGNGYIVVAPNRRGVPGFGQEWNEQISRDYGGQNIRDLLSAIDEVAGEPYVDSDRLGAVGASYGGFAVNYLAGHHEGRFKAFISHCGIFNFEQMYVTTEEMWFENWDIGGPYWDGSNEAAQRSYGFSPHKFVQKWDTPMLVIHGGNDFRIPYTQGMGAFNAAILRDIPAWFLYFPDESHWVMKPQNGILWQRVFSQWLDKWLK
jgi:dipeptidyl aminopeptidase/acylaminoacyl peptidase